jgi:hypothetical protein
MTTAISEMRKAEVIAELLSMGEIVSDADLLAQLKERLKEARVRAGTSGKKVPKWGLEGLSGLCKADLITRAEGVGLKPTLHQTRNQLIDMIRNHVLLEAPLSGDEIVMFGKCKGHSMRDIRKNHVSYAHWVIETDADSQGTAHPELARLARYLRREPSPERATVTTKTKPPPEGYEHPEPKPWSKSYPSGSASSVKKEETAVEAKEREKRINAKLSEIDKIKQELQEIKQEQERGSSSKRSAEPRAPTMPVDQVNDPESGNILAYLKSLGQRLENLEQQQETRSNKSWEKVSVPTDEEAL